MNSVEYQIPVIVQNVNQKQVGNRLDLFKEQILIELLIKQYSLPYPSVELAKFVFDRVVKIESKGFNTETFYVDYKKPTEQFLFKTKLELRENNKMFFVVETENSITSILNIWMK